MKFRVGQPVWTIAHCTGKWRAATVVGFYDKCSKCSTCGHVTTGEQVYATESVDGLRPPHTDIFPHWGFPESRIVPRDQDQFQAADESFEWRSKEREGA